MDLTVEKNIVELMKSSCSQKEWHENYDEVEAANNGIPEFWFDTVILSGVLTEARCNWANLTNL